MDGVGFVLIMICHGASSVSWSSCVCGDSPCPLSALSMEIYVLVLCLESQEIWIFCVYAFSHGASFCSRNRWKIANKNGADVLEAMPSCGQGTYLGLPLLDERAYLVQL